MINLVAEALEELKLGGKVEKAQVLALLAIAEALREIAVIGQILEDRTINVQVENISG